MSPTQHGVTFTSSTPASVLYLLLDYLFDGSTIEYKEKESEEDHNNDGNYVDNKIPLSESFQERLEPHR